MLYGRIAELTKLRQATPALREGRQVVRVASDKPGFLAFSRLLGKTEVLAVFNTGDQPSKADIPVETGSVTWRRCMAPALERLSRRVVIPSNSSRSTT